MSGTLSISRNTAARMRSRAGVAIVSGFELAEVASVGGALSASGAAVRESHAKNSWAAVVAERG